MQTAQPIGQRMSVAKKWFLRNFAFITLALGITVFASSIAFAVVMITYQPDYGIEPEKETSLSGGENVIIRPDRETGVPIILTGNIESPMAEKSLAAAISFFEANKDLYQMIDPAGELILNRQDQDELGMSHLRISQVHQGIPVYGSELIVHFSAEGNIVTVNGNYHPGVDVAVEPEISAETALMTAQADMGSGAVPATSEPPQLVIYPQKGRKEILAWKTAVLSEEPFQIMLYFVDAHTGTVAEKINDLR